MKTIYLFLIFILSNPLYSGQSRRDGKKDVSNSFDIIVPFKYNSKDHFFKLTCTKTEDNEVEISNIASNFSLPENFYALLKENFTINNRIAKWDNFEKSYNYYKEQNFIEKRWIEYLRTYFKDFSGNLIYIVDLDKDGYDDVLMINSQNSMTDNDVYLLFKGSKKGISYDKNFFGKMAFYGWDKTGKYMITGTSDTEKRVLYKNKIANGKITIINKCIENAKSDKRCW